MPGFFLTNSIQLSQVSALVNLTDISLGFGMADAYKCLEKKTKTTKTLYKENLGSVHVLKSVHEPIRVRKKSLTARFVTDADADTHMERIYGCLSFTTVSIFTDTDSYTDHGHGSQFTDLCYGWLALQIFKCGIYW